MQTEAAILRGTNDPFTVEMVELADPGPNQVLVEIAGVGMCHSDLAPRGNPNFSPIPFLGGHEGAGVVKAIGSMVTNIEVGNHVVLSFDSCGECSYCLRGHPAWCDTYRLRNFQGGPPDACAPVIDANGNEIKARWFAQSSFAGYSLATSRNAVVVDPSLPIELLGPLGCGFLTGAGAVLSATKVQPSSNVAVFGAGAVGLAAVMAARMRISLPSIFMTIVSRSPAKLARLTSLRDRRMVLPMTSSLRRGELTTHSTSPVFRRSLRTR